MKIGLKENLRALRLQKNITQETLANHLGFTPQSVSKWERGEGFPDITMLPNIAFYFGVTVDELLCVDPARIEETVQEYLRQSMVYKKNGENEKNLALWEEAYSNFPNDCRVMNELMGALNREAAFPCPKEKAERIIALGEALLAHSTDVAQRENAVYWLCRTYGGMGDKEKALFYANMGGNLNLTRDVLRANVLYGAEGVRACQSYIMALTQVVSATAVTMAKKADISHKEAIEIYQFAIDVLLRLFSDGNLGLFAQNVAFCYLYIAEEYVGARDWENALCALEKCGEYATADATADVSDFTVPIVKGLHINRADTLKNYSENACSLLLNELKNDRYDPLRDKDAFRKIVSALSRYAK